MKLMVIIEGMGRPYTVGESIRKISPIESLKKIKKITKDTSYKDNDSHKFNVPKKQYQNLKKMSKKERVFLARDIMSSPVLSLAPTDQLETAWDLMCDKRFRHIPISPDGKKIVGILSDRDVLKNVVHIKNNKLTKSPSQGMLVKDVMNSTVLTASDDAEIREISRILFEQRIGCMPIINGKEFLMGMITRSDILRIVTNNAPFELWC